MRCAGWGRVWTMSGCWTPLLYKSERGPSRFCEMAPELLSGRRDLNPRPLDPQDAGVSVSARQARCLPLVAASAVGRAPARTACGPHVVPNGLRTAVYNLPGH